MRKHKYSFKTIISFTERKKVMQHLHYMPSEPSPKCCHDVESKLFRITLSSMLEHYNFPSLELMRRAQICSSACIEHTRSIKTWFATAVVEELLWFYIWGQTWPHSHWTSLRWFGIEIEHHAFLSNITPNLIKALVAEWVNSHSHVPKSSGRTSQKNEGCYSSSEVTKFISRLEGSWRKGFWSGVHILLAIQCISAMWKVIAL